MGWTCAREAFLSFVLRHFACWAVWSTILIRNPGLRMCLHLTLPEVSCVYFAIYTHICYSICQKCDSNCSHGMLRNVVPGTFSIRISHVTDVVFPQMLDIRQNTGCCSYIYNRIEGTIQDIPNRTVWSQRSGCLRGKPHVMREIYYHIYWCLSFFFLF